MARPAPLLSCLTILAILLLVRPDGRAQFSPYGNPNTAPYSILPLARLLQSLNNAVYSSLDFFYFDQRWDAGARHYRSRLPEYFHYPAIAAAGYSSFRLEQSDSRQPQQLSEGTDIRSFIRETDQHFDEDRARLIRTLYHYSKTGWLVAITQRSLAPASEYFAEITDSFRYDGSAGGLSGIQWLHKEYSTGTGYAASIYCDTIPPFHHIRKRSEVYLSFDAYQNLTSVESRSSEKWEDCDHGGPKHWRRSMRYDGLGRVVRIADSSESMTGVSLEYLFDYREEEAAAFLKRVAADPLYAPFRDTAVARWLQRQGPLRYLALRKTAKTYTTYDSKQHRQVLSGGPPAVQTDSSFFLLDEKRQRVAFWESKSANSSGSYITLYSRLYDSAVHACYEAQRVIARPSAAAPRSLVEEPYRVLLSGFEIQRYDTASRGNFSLIRFSTGRSAGEDQQDRQLRQGLRLGASEDARQIRGASFTAPGAAALLDRSGLVRYLWLPYTTYKLSYE